MQSPRSPAGLLKRGHKLTLLNTRNIFGAGLLSVTLLIYVQNNRQFEQSRPAAGSTLRADPTHSVRQRAGSLSPDDDADGIGVSMMDAEKDLRGEAARPADLGQEAQAKSNSKPGVQQGAPKPRHEAERDADTKKTGAEAYWMMLKRKRAAGTGTKPSTGQRSLPKSGSSQHGSRSGHSSKSHAALGENHAAGLVTAEMQQPVTPRSNLEEDMYIPMPINGKEWYEWDQWIAHEYQGNLSLHCRIPFEGMHHSEKIEFFRSHPMCNYMNMCDADVPLVQESKVVMEYAGYIEQYSDKIRYMHMAMLAQLPTGTLLAAWQASPIVMEDLQERDMLAVEGLDLQHLRFSYSRDPQGRTWSASKRIPIPQQAALWSPVLHVDKSGKTWLFYSESVGCRKSYECHPCVPRIRHPCGHKPPSQTEVCHTDPGLWTPGGHIKVVTSSNPLAADPKWSTPRLLLSSQSGGGIPKVICNRLVVLSTGEWLLPYWREQTPGAVEDGTCKIHEKGEMEVQVMNKDGSPAIGADGRPVMEKRTLHPGSDCFAGQETTCATGAREYSGVLRSTDGGKIWKARGSIMAPNTHLIEGTLAELRNGTVMMIFRTQVGCLYKSLSYDKGLTWSSVRPLNLPNPNSKVHLMRMEPSGHLLLAFNNHRGANTYRGLKNCRGCRSRMHLAMSIDDGENWRHIVSLDDELSSSAVRIHYPCMLQLGQELRLMVAYSRFYLGRKMGLWSPDQGVVIMRLNMDDVMENLDEIFRAPDHDTPPGFVAQAQVWHK